MSGRIELVAIPKEQWHDYRLRVIFEAYKWDPQVGDHDTIAGHAVLLDSETARELETLAEQLAAETVQMEKTLAKRLALTKPLSLPRKIQRALPRLSGYEEKNHVRLMRFDFHPTADGWAVSEVNSDVPGGLAEASVLPRLCAPFFAGALPPKHTGNLLLQTFAPKIRAGGRVALVHATSYADDRQVMQFVGDTFAAQGYEAVYAAPDHIRWVDGRAICIAEGCEGPVDALIRFFPLEWLTALPRGSDWQGYFDTKTPSCNHPVAILTQSKRLPLVWDKLGLALSGWQTALPETRAPKGLGGDKENWIYKPAFGRVGEGISIREAIPAKEFKRIRRAATLHPKDWAAQRRFLSQPIPAPDGAARHLCLGVFTVDGKAAGFYGRMSPKPRIDGHAQDVPILIRGEQS
ncbi:MAG: glutathionylspermidine synthase family protein [Clostridiales bacterium]|nr:glutathionylspermidine synthase family protein [Clostridiales bacterium]